MYTFKHIVRTLNQSKTRVKCLRIAHTSTQNKIFIVQNQCEKGKKALKGIKRVNRKS